MGNDRAGLPREKRITIMMTEAEIAEVEDARYAHRKPTQSETVRFLIKKGLEAVAGESRARASPPN